MKFEDKMTYPQIDIYADRHHREYRIICFFSKILDVISFKHSFLSLQKVIPMKIRTKVQYHKKIKSTEYIMDIGNT